MNYTVRGPVDQIKNLARHLAEAYSVDLDTLDESRKKYITMSMTHALVGHALDIPLNELSEALLSEFDVASFYEDLSKVDPREFFTYTENGREGCMKLSAETTQSPSLCTIYWFIHRYAPDAEILYEAHNYENRIYVTNDPEIHFKYFLDPTQEEYCDMAGIEMPKEEAAARKRLAEAGLRRGYSEFGMCSRPLPGFSEVEEMMQEAIGVPQTQTLSFPGDCWHKDGYEIIWAHYGDIYPDPGTWEPELERESTYIELRNSHITPNRYYAGAVEKALDAILSELHIAGRDNVTEYDASALIADRMDPAIKEKIRAKGRDIDKSLWIGNRLLGIREYLFRAKEPVIITLPAEAVSDAHNKTTKGNNIIEFSFK